MTPLKPTPVGLALIVCDMIIEDKLTNKKSLIGTFNNIAAPTFPCRHPKMCVFVSLTEGKGSYAARLRIINEDTQQSVVDMRGNIQMQDINAVVELNFDLVGIVFPAPGLYSIEFYCDDALLMERRFNVSQIQQPPPPPKGPPPAEL
jgi:hypothetical protein